MNEGIQTSKVSLLFFEQQDIAGTYEIEVLKNFKTRPE